MILLALLVVTSGCLGFVAGQDPLRTEAKPATVDAATLAETEYELDQRYERRVERTVTMVGLDRDVAAVNEVAEYRKPVEFGPLSETDVAVFAVATTPAFEVGGETFSPVDEMTNHELAERLQDRYERIDVGRYVDSQQVPALGKQLTLARFEGNATVKGTEIDVYVHVGKVRHGDDFVVVVGIYPQLLGGEEDDVLAMIEGLEHEP